MSHVKDCGFYSGEMGNLYKVLNRGVTQLEFYHKKITLTARGPKVKAETNQETITTSRGEVVVAWARVAVAIRRDKLLEMFLRQRHQDFLMNWVGMSIKKRQQLFPEVARGDL